ncbi:hypothetical protein [Dyella choica]|uniref:WD40 repeat domain-containing protein n=1 Tax=Dyella choica TaxID=1927959 RepID=A0A432M2D0_9GAMM|nr:hypothetical protein [Dyella choica]RUL72436.1 hypothetical protein EKH80_17260 [Dyella choica]
MRHKRGMWKWAVAIVVILVSVRGAQSLREVRQASTIDVLDTVQLSYVLLPGDARWSARAFGADFDVTPTSAMIFRHGDSLYGVNEDGKFATLPVQGTVPASFAVDNQGTLLVQREGYLGRLTESGAIDDALPLPYEDMRLAHSSLDGMVYLFGGGDGDYRVYSFADDGSMRILLSVPQPIVGVADCVDAVYAATDRQIFRMGKDAIRLVLNLPENGETIVSVAASTDGKVVFFSTTAKVYALHGAGAVAIVGNSGGALRLRNDTLYVLDDERKLLYKVRPATMQLFGGHSS